MTIWCNDCKTAHPWDSLRRVRTGVEDETELVCPSCGSNDLADAAQCQYCGEWMSESDMWGNEVEGMCGACYAKAAKGIKKTIEAHGSKAELAILQHIMGVRNGTDQE